MPLRITSLDSDVFIILYVQPYVFQTFFYDASRPNRSGYASAETWIAPPRATLLAGTAQLFALPLLLVVVVQWQHLVATNSRAVLSWVLPGGALGLLLSLLLWLPWFAELRWAEIAIMVDAGTLCMCLGLWGASLVARSRWAKRLDPRLRAEAGTTTTVPNDPESRKEAGVAPASGSDEESPAVLLRYLWLLPADLYWSLIMSWTAAGLGRRVVYCVVPLLATSPQHRWTVDYWFEPVISLASGAYYLYFLAAYFRQARWRTAALGAGLVIAGLGFGLLRLWARVPGWQEVTIDVALAFVGFNLAVTGVVMLGFWRDRANSEKRVLQGEL